MVDLLIAMANAAANSSRANLILDPYPSIVDPSNSTSFAMDPKVCVVLSCVMLYILLSF